MKSRLLIIDLSNFIFRAFYGIGPLKNSDGHPTGAIYGVANMFLTMFKELQPTHVVIAVDAQGRKDRKEIYEDYKSNRSSAPEELIQQIKPIKEMLTLMNFCLIEEKGMEADDVIGSLSTQNQNNFDSIYIASGDKDLMQLVHNNVFMYDSMKNKIFNRKAVFEKFNIYPEQIIDYLSLVGDKSDNVPGVAGIGPKSAVNLLTEYSTLENVYDNIDKISSASSQRKLNENRDNAFLSKRLVTINNDITIHRDISDCFLNLKLSPELEKFLSHYNCFSIIKKIKNI